MPKCSHCNGEVAWDSKRCPRCDKQNPAGCARLILFGIILFILWAILTSQK